MATSFGLAQVIRDNYPNKNVKVAADIEDWTPSLRYMDDYIDWNLDTTSPEHDDYLAIIGDVSGVNRVAYFDNFKNSIKNTIVYDHHENPITVPNVDVYWSQPKYPAAGIMAYELVKSMDLEIKPVAALIINHGIITDTAFYKLAPADNNTFEATKSLNEIIGVELQKELYSKMSQRTMNDIRFEGWVLGNFKLLEDKVAYMTITKLDLERFNYKPEQAAKVNLLADIEGIEAWVFFIEYDDHIRTEFRSKNIHVDKIATEFGGGGHNHKSGCPLQSMEEHTKVINRVLEVTKENGY